MVALVISGLILATSNSLRPGNLPTVRSLPPRDMEVPCTLVITISDSYIKGTTFSTFSPVKEIPRANPPNPCPCCGPLVGCAEPVPCPPGSASLRFLAAHAKLGLVFPKAGVVGWALRGTAPERARVAHTHLRKAPQS